MLNLRFIRNIRLGVKNLLLHKLRSLLTMLGVVFGVASVVAMLAVGEGASQEALEQIRKLGSRNIIVSTKKPAEEEQGSNQRTRIAIYGLHHEDELRVQETFETAARVVPVKVARQESRVGTRSMELRIVGTTPAWFDLVQRPVVAGRVLKEIDTQRRANAIVLTEHGARKLLATASTVGEHLRVGSNAFEVVGIVKSEESQGGNIQLPDQAIDGYIPISTARERFGDTSVRRSGGSRESEMVELHQLIVEADSDEAVEPLAAGIEAMMRQFHPKGDYQISVPLALLRQAEATKRTFNIVLGSIAGISLLVGGIGIMNIMLASVTERTREIGIRRAIGAKRRQIIAQFLTETVVLSLAGGLVGVAVGVAIPYAITYAADMPTVVTTWSVLLALTISAGVGIIFGLYPAVRAARLDPIVALRHE